MAERAGFEGGKGDKKKRGFAPLKLASAILEQLLHYCYIIPIGGPGHRIKYKLENLKKGRMSV
ncbi:hypothetical protein ACFLWO_04735 [Chloroflexota bacterium]